MKNIVICCFCLLISSGVFAQKNEIPEMVKTAFQKQYPTITTVTWDKEGQDYEATFLIDKLENMVIYDNKGKFLQSKAVFPISQLPKTITDYIKQHYVGVVIEKSAKVTNIKGAQLYEVAIKGKDLVFDDKGKFLNEEKEDTQEDED